MILESEMQEEIILMSAKETAAGNQSRIPLLKIDDAAMERDGVARKGMQIVRAERRMMDE